MEKFFNKQGKNDSGRTPEWLKQYVFNKWGEYHDVTPFNPKFNPKTDPDALKIDWKSPVYCNPPYSHYKPFLKKGYDLWKKKGTVSIFLVKTDHLCTKLFEQLSEECELRFFTRRLKFQGYKHNAPFPSVLIIFDGKKKNQFSVIPVPKTSQESIVNG